MKKFGLTVLLLAAPDLALAANSSVYTSFDLKKCAVLQAAVPNEEFGGSYVCKAYAGLKLYFAEGDLRTMIAFGKQPEKHCAATQSFGHFNSANSAIEWRLSKGKPIATIQRWNVASGDSDAAKDKSWLVVTKLEPTNSCRMAVIEGAMPNANAKAREVADQLAASFKCASDEEKIFALPATNKEDAGGSGTCEKN